MISACEVCSARLLMNHAWSIVADNKTIVVCTICKHSKRAKMPTQVIIVPRREVDEGYDTGLDFKSWKLWDLFRRK